MTRRSLFASLAGILVGRKVAEHVVPPVWEGLRFIYPETNPSAWAALLHSMEPAYQDLIDQDGLMSLPTSFTSALPSPTFPRPSNPNGDEPSSST